MKTEQEAYEHWRDTFWKFGSSTDEARAKRAWAEARAAVFSPGPMELEVDPDQWAVEELRNQTSIYIRARVDGQYQAVDIAVLKKESLRAWLKSRGGSNPWAESTVLLMLGYNFKGE